MYNQIAANKRKTWLLILLVSGLMIGLFALFGYIFEINVWAAIMVGSAVALVHSLVSYFLADRVALSVSGAKPVAKQDAPELYNLVENLCLANGQPTPKIYIIPDDSPNAFATGRDPEHASITFTSGILRLLDKQELQGVAAHELSHVKNYDIRVMTIVVVLVGVIMLTANVFVRSLRFRGNDKRDSFAIFALLGFLLALLSPVFAKLIQLAISRQREYLADASGALLTRYPEGLAQALEKLEAVDKPLATANEATAHLFITNPFGRRGRGLAQLMSTHPPLEKRIARLRSMDM